MEKRGGHRAYRAPGNITDTYLPATPLHLGKLREGERPGRPNRRTSRESLSASRIRHMQTGQWASSVPSRWTGMRRGSRGETLPNKIPVDPSRPSAAVTGLSRKRSPLTKACRTSFSLGAYQHARPHAPKKTPSRVRRVPRGRRARLATAPPGSPRSVGRAGHPARGEAKRGVGE